MSEKSQNLMNSFLDEARAQAASVRQTKELAAQLRVALLLRAEVQERIKISRAALYAKLNPVDPAYDPTFPVPVRVGARAVRWIESEVDSYIASLPRTRSVEAAA